MKEAIVTVAAIVLAVVIYLLIAGDTNSLKSESQRIMNSTRTQLQTIQP